MTKKSKAEQDELNKRHLEKMTELLGTTNGSSNWREKIRIHQGWWRAFVLGISEGEYYDNRNKIWKRICNQVFQETSTDDINFLSNTAYQSVKNTLSGRNNISSGMIDEDRLKFNLLSSQPLCFNFFGELIEDLDFGAKILQCWFPEVSKLKNVLFEYAPKEKNLTTILHLILLLKLRLIKCKQELLDSNANTQIHSHSNRKNQKCIMVT